MLLRAVSIEIVQNLSNLFLTLSSLANELEEAVHASGWWVEALRRNIFFI